MKWFSIASVSLVAVALAGAEEPKIEWTNDLTTVKTPNAPVSGTLLGVPFKMDVVECSPGSLMFKAGKEGVSHYSIAIVLPNKSVVELAGKSFELGPKTGTRQTRPSIHLSIRPNLNEKLKSAIYQIGYSLRLEFGELKNGAIAGKIYLCLPDRDKSVIAGTFSIAAK